MKPKAVADTCVCLDLWHGKVLPNIRDVGLGLILPDLVAEELKSPGAGVFVGAGMTVLAGDGGVVALAYHWRGIYPKPSVANLFALALAKRVGAILLTGDKHLRAAADAEEVEARGILWILDRLEDKLSRSQLAEALELILAHGAFLPRTECDRRLKVWRE